MSCTSDSDATKLVPKTESKDLGVMLASILTL